MTALRQRIDELEREVARLREALAQIDTVAKYNATATRKEMVLILIREIVARAALSETRD